MNHLVSRIVRGVRSAVLLLLACASACVAPVPSLPLPHSRPIVPADGSATTARADAEAAAQKRDSGKWYRQDRVTGSTNFHMGGRYMGSSSFDGLSDQFLSTVDVDVTPRRWPIGFEGSFSGSFDDRDYHGICCYGESAYVSDFAFGLRKTAYLRGFRPYIGAGAAWVYADIDRWFGNLFVHDEESSWGWYAHAGCSYRWPQGMNVGVDFRWTFGTDADFFGGDGDLDSWQFSLFFGYAW